MSRPAGITSPSPALSSPVPQDSPTRHHAAEPSTTSIAAASTPREEGYPSWLPKRPLHPAPASTIQSFIPTEDNGGFTRPTTSASGPGVDEIFEERQITGRKATPRSVRIVSVPDGRRLPTDPPRAGHGRVWSRATAAALSPTLFSESPLPLPPAPRFRVPAFKPELLQSPYWTTRLRFYLLPIVVFAHIPLQFFFDFNTVFMLIQVAKYPDPIAPALPGSGSNWILAVIAYFCCFFIWLFGVLIIYEIVYSFYRRWRVKRPLIFPIYLSAPAFNLVSMTSYTNFCFLLHLRKDAFRPDHGNWHDGLAETFWFYSQNLPTIALLLPRAALSLSLLFAFSSPQPTLIALANAGMNTQRDTTYFNSTDGSLTNYARGTLIAHCAWAAWRTIVLIVSWFGLWFLSGQSCGGVCGPRFRWEEDQGEKYGYTTPIDPGDEPDGIIWEWRECTRQRLQEAYEFCLTSHPRSSSKLPPSKRERSDTSEMEQHAVPSPFAALEQVLMSSRTPGRAALSSELFESPVKEEPQLSSIIPPIVEQRERTLSEGSGPLLSLPFPFPEFPPPVVTATNRSKESGRGSIIPFPTPAVPRTQDDDDTVEPTSPRPRSENEEKPTSDRGTGSMSSLGQPLNSPRYPFAYRRPVPGATSRGSGVGASSRGSGAGPSSRGSHGSFHSRSASTPHSKSTSSHVPSSPHSRLAASSIESPTRSITEGMVPISVIPPPPRHPRGRRRTATESSPSPTPVVQHHGRRDRRRTMSAGGPSSPAPEPLYESSGDEKGGGGGSAGDEYEAEGSQEAAEQDDSVGLLSAASSPRTSLAALRARAGSLTHRRGSTKSSSGSSRRGSADTKSAAEEARSRAQSLIQSKSSSAGSSRTSSNAAPYSDPQSIPSGDARTRPRTHSDGVSEAQLSSSPVPRSSGETGAGDHTFGIQVPWRQRPTPTITTSLARQSPSPPPVASGSGSRSRPRVQSELSAIAPSERTVSAAVIPVPTFGGSSPQLTVPQQPLLTVQHPNVSQSSHPDISSANQSFVTAPASLEGSTTDQGSSSHGGANTWGRGRHPRYHTDDQGMLGPM